jgi:hypothetical protein
VEDKLNLMKDVMSLLEITVLVNPRPRKSFEKLQKGAAHVPTIDQATRRKVSFLTKEVLNDTPDEKSKRENKEAEEADAREREEKKLQKELEEKQKLHARPNEQYGLHLPLLHARPEERSRRMMLFTTVIGMKA